MRSKPQIGVTIPAETAQYAREQAAQRKESLSDFIAHVIEQDRLIRAGPLANVLAVQQRVTEDLKSLGLKYELLPETNRPAPDILIPELRLAIEVKNRFLEGKPEVSLITALVSVFSQGLAAHALIVLPDAVTSEDKTSFKRLTENFTLYPVEVITLPSLRGRLTELKKSLSRRR